MTIRSMHRSLGSSFHGFYYLGDSLWYSLTLLTRVADPDPKPRIPGALQTSSSVTVR